MKRSILIGGTVAAAIAAGPALAADMPMADYTPPPAAAPAPVFYDWSGIYMGVNAGYGWGDFGFGTVDADVDGVGTFAHGPFGFDADGFLAGGQIGANWQIDQFVFGIEADLQWSDLDGSAVLANWPIPADGDDTLVQGEIGWFGTVRGRLGFAVDRLLVYGTGGLAYGDVDIGATVDFPGGSSSGSSSETHLGWTLGAGVEGAITDNLSAKIEYLYVDLGSEDYHVNFAGDVGGSGTTDLDFDAHIVRAGLNYRFNW